MPLNETEKTILAREAESAFLAVKRTQKNLTEYRAEYERAQEKHAEAAARWQALSRHYVEPQTDEDAPW